MNLRDLTEKLKYISLAHPLINDFYEGDFNKINSENNRYPLIGIIASDIEFGQTSRFTLNIYYIDRLLEDESNKIIVQTNGHQALQQILNTFNMEDNVTLEQPYSLQPYTEEFTDICAGAFGSINVEVANLIGECGTGQEVLNPFDNYYTKIETDTKFRTIEDSYSQAEVELLVNTRTKIIRTYFEPTDNLNNIIWYDFNDGNTKIYVEGVWVVVGGDIDAYTKAETDALLSTKQDTLTAGTNITIDANNVISASGTISIPFEDKYADTIANWEMIGGTYNSTSGFFEYDELTDITLEQAVDSFKKSRPLFHQNNYRLAYMLSGAPRIFINILVRDNSSSPVVKPYLQQLFYASNTIEYANFNYCSADCPDTFFNASSLKYIKWIRIQTLTANTFKGCTGLIYTYKMQLPAVDVWMGDSLNLSYDGCAQIIFDWLNGSTSVTWTVHSDIWNKIYEPTNPDYTQWNALDGLASAKNISIVSA